MSISIEAAQKALSGSSSCHIQPLTRELLEQIVNQSKTINQLAEVLKQARDKLAIECTGQKEYTGGVPIQCLIPLIDGALKQSGKSLDGE